MTDATPKPRPRVPAPSGVGLRDMLASQCMVGLLCLGLPGSSDDYAQRAYQLADAMLRARAKGATP